MALDEARFRAFDPMRVIRRAIPTCAAACRSGRPAGTACLLAILALLPLAQAEVLRVLTYNIHHGEGTDGRFDYPRLADRIRSLDPDVVALQEVDRGTRRAGGVDQAQRVADLLGMHAAFGAAMPFDGGEYGQAILSRFPLGELQVHPLPFAFGEEPRILLRVRIQPPEGLPAFDFLSTHLCHQSPETRRGQVRQILGVLEDSGGTPAILAGDFNALAGAPEMQDLLSGEWIDAAAPDSRIDYVLVRRLDAWRVESAEIPDDRIVSDHPPVLTVLRWLGEQEVSVDATPRSLQDLRAIQERLQPAIRLSSQSVVAVDGGRGGGIIVSPDGYVLTASHVSAPGRRVRITLADGALHDGQSLGAFRFADAGLIKIDGQGPFPHVPMAAMDHSRVGEWCYALGHPGGLDEERGVVARVGRIIEKSDNLLRSDCRIVGGDSGCALFNMRGELIGIHSRIGQPLDMNFHAPVEAYRRNWKELVSGEVVPPNRMRRRGGLGIETADAQPGVRVVRVFGDGSPLRKGDVIRRVDSYPVADTWEFSVALSARRIDETVALQVLRDGGLHDLEARVRRPGGRPPSP